MSGVGPEDEDQVPDPARWRILVVLLVTMFMSLIGVSIVNAVARCPLYKTQVCECNAQS